MQIPGGALELVPLIPVVAIVMWGMVWTIRSQISHAIAKRISGSGSELQEEVTHLSEEIAQLRAELERTNERVDFAERMLTQGSAPETHPTPV